MDLEEAEIEAFVAEVGDRLQQYDDSLLDFEAQDTNKELLHKIFRVAHTIKGNAGFVGLDNMVRLAHAVESLFAQLRDDEIRLEQSMAGHLLEAGDVLRKILDAFAANDPAARKIEVESLSAKIESYLAGNGNENALPVDEGRASTDSPGAEPGYFWIAITLRSGTALPGARAYLLRRKVTDLGQIVSENPSVEDYDAPGFTGHLEIVLASTASIDELKKNIRSLEIESIDIKAIDNPEVAAAPKSNEPGEEKQASETLFVSDSKPTGGEAPDARTARGSGQPQSTREQVDALRVPVRKVDDLLNLVGELLSANSHYVALAAEFRQKYGSRDLFVNFRENSEQLGRISAELQEKVMKVRMIPVGTVFSRFRRLVRDFNASHPEKSVVLNTRGEDTEVDKTQIDKIYDPLLHLIRNSIDHGIEERDARLASGKSESGQVLLNSYQAGNHIYIEVEDDGKGLDVDRIRKRAIERGLVSEEAAAQMNASAIHELIFQPGFSTAEQVTDLSGRGVGMDVVRRNIESLNGTVDIDSRPGLGSRFRVQLPLSLAIVTALKVRINERLYAIPINTILETIKVDEKSGIREIEGREIVEVRDEHVSLIRVAREIGLEQKPGEASANLQNRAIGNRHLRNAHKKSVVIVQYRGDRVGLLVDDLLGYEDMVIKSLARNYEDIEGLSGAAILGRGEICLILDVQRLIDSVLGDSAGPSTRTTSQPEVGATRPTPREARTADAKQVNSAPDTTAPVTGARASEAVPASPGPLTGSDAPVNPTTRLSREDLDRIKGFIKEGRSASIQALRAVAQSERIDLRFSETRLQSFERLKHSVEERFAAGGAHAFTVQLDQELQGNMLLIITEPSLIKLAGLMYDPDRFDNSSGASPETVSAIREVTNLISVSFTNAMSKLTGSRILPGPPLHMPEYQQVFAHGVLKDHEAHEPTLVIETEFKAEDDSTLFYFYILPGADGFEKLVQLHRHNR